MNIKCGLCGNEIAVDGNLVDGQHVGCPYCGGKFEYRKPSAIEPLSDADGVPEIPAYERNPNLYIRRPGKVDACAEDGRRNALVDQVEARAKADAKRKMMMRLKKCASNVIAMLVLIGLAAIGFKFYKSWNGGAGSEHALDGVVRHQNDSDELPKLVTDSVAVKKTKQDLVKKGESKEDKTETDANRATIADDFESVRNLFIGCRVSYWGKLPKKERPGAVSGLFHLFVPEKNGAGEYYVIQSTATNALNMSRLTERPEPRRVYGNSDYAKLLTKRGGFILKNDVAYLVTPVDGKKMHQAPTQRGESFNPAEEVFGLAYSMAQKMNVTDLRFRVLFGIDGYGEPQDVAEVRFGETVPYSEFKKVATLIAKEMRRDNTPPPMKAKAFKRTVVLYDGRIISKGADGITKVPRVASNLKGSYDDWSRLYNEALRQESEAQRCVAEANRAKNEWNAKINRPITEGEIRKVLFAGNITVKRM